MTAAGIPHDSSATRVCVVGESIVDIVRSGNSVVEHAGGSPLNVAVGVARLGLAVDALTYLGEDAHGTWLRSHLEASGVQSVHSATGIGRATSTAKVTLDADWLGVVCVRHALATAGFFRRLTRDAPDSHGLDRDGARTGRDAG